MPLGASNGLNVTEQPQEAAPKPLISKISSFRRAWGDSSENTSPKNGDLNSQTDNLPISSSTAQHASSLRFIQEKLKSGNAGLLRSKYKFAAKVSDSIPTRPTKRKSEVLELSDSEGEADPQPKRRPPISNQMYSSAPEKSVMPWDKDHTDKKVSPMIEQSGPAAAVAKAPSKNAELISLSKQQKAILDVVMEGKNVFFTGSAGTGKSVLLKNIIRSMRNKYRKNNDAVAVTASTGIAACNIGGITLHSFGGVGLAQETAAALAEKVKKNQKASSRWKRTRALVIDEISMLDGDFFDKLETVARIVRGDPKPFGGIQLILTGDFFQLPPVTRGQVKFAFNANCWKSCMERTFNLTKVFRQKDQQFIDMLNEMRFGHLSENSIRIFSSKFEPLPDDGIAPTELFPRREDVENANRERMDKLEGEVEAFIALDGGSADPRSRDNILNSFMAPKELKLKVNAQVMMIKNMDDQLVNGTVGKVVDFMTETEWALSGINGASLMDRKEKAEEKKGKQRSVEKKYPVVEWKIVGSRHVRTDLVRPEQFKVEGPNGNVEVSRQQLPLILAWAMSIHKSQGQTLEKVKIDLRKVFEKGQAYVAISRATSLEGLQIIGFQASKVYAHPAVVEWSKALMS